MKLEIFEINQIAIFKANRLMVQDLVALDNEKAINHFFYIFLLPKFVSY